MQVLHYLLLAGGGASERGCLPMGGRTGRGRLAMAIFRPGAFLGGRPRQYSRFMHPRRGPGREKRPSLATYRRRASKMGWRWQDMRAMYAKSPANRRWRIHHAYILPGRGPFRRTDPSNHAYRADLAIRCRRTARAIASTALPLWRGSLPRDGRTGRGRLLVGRGGAAEGVRGVVGCRALTEKPASAKRRLRVSDADSLVESRKPAFAGRVRTGRRQGGADQAAPPIKRPRRVRAARCLCKRLFRLRTGYAANFQDAPFARSEPPAFRSMKKLARWYFLH